MPLAFLFSVLLFVIFVLAAAAILPRVFSAAKAQSKYKPQFTYRKKEYLMSERERLCYNALSSAVGAEFYVFPQIHLDCLLEPQAYGRDNLYAFRHINQKSVDFVICDKRFKTLLAIELDDRTHERSDRVARDSVVSTVLKNAGVPLLRIQRGDFDVQNLAAGIKAAIDAPPQ